MLWANYRGRDKTDFRLSDLQKETFQGWYRPWLRESSPRRSEGKGSTTPWVYDLVQDVITDCSVVASLCVITSRTARGFGDIIRSCFHPYNSATNAPTISCSGKYVFRFYFNGCYRKIVIDDRLPESKTERSLHVIDRNDSNVYWPALVEKAYLKVRGGYDFPGSNSGTDLWVLSGWLPEQLFLQSDDIERESLWQRISKAYGYGDVLISLGTGKLSKQEEHGMGLVGEHDYAVIDVGMLHGQRAFLMKNPWSNGQVWKGHICRPEGSLDLSQELEKAQLKDESIIRYRSTTLLPGTFWMPWNEIFQNFESIYLNWNPGLFSYKEDVHFKWDLSITHSTDGFLEGNPQYNIKSSASGLVWLVLNRYFTSHDPGTKGQNLDNDHTHRASRGQEGFVSLYAFLNKGTKVFFNNRAIGLSPYVDSPNALLKCEAKLDQVLTIVISEQALPRQSHSFTLSAYSLSPIEMSPVPEKYIYRVQRQGSWTTRSSGGNAGSPYYHVNPQFSITLDVASDICLFLQNPEQKWPVHVKLVWAGGKQVQSVTTRDVVGDSGEHRKGYAFVEMKVIPAGSYTIVCSTFEQGQTGKFDLRVSSTTPCRVEKVMVANAGRFITRAETVILPPGEDRYIAQLTSQRLNRLSVSAKCRDDTQSPTKHSCSPLKVSIELGKGAAREVLAVSGADDFVDARRVGIATPDVDILPLMSTKGIRVALERLGCSGIPYDEHVDIQILSDGPCEIGKWSRADFF